MKNFYGRVLRIRNLMPKHASDRTEMEPFTQTVTAHYL